MAYRFELERELDSLGLLDKAREIHTELGEDAALSYIRSSFRLLSKVYHPDLNPKKPERAKEIQQRLNEVNRILNLMSDDELLELIGKNLKVIVADNKKKVLVVEDEFGLQETLRNIFIMEGYETRIAVDGRNGYAVYRQFKPHLILTDVVMPEMNGIDLVRKVRKEDQKIKVIFMSGFFGIKKLKQDLDDEILKHGYRTLSKPFKISDLLDLVQQYLDEPG
ncbi:MAG: response regulator [Syntrophobacterales bacterium]|nr:response regulator [Syntrophobacterales bacterium]